MPPNDPCRGCRFVDGCHTAGLICRLAMEAWIDDRLFECPDWQEERYHGLEGVRP